MFFKQYRRASGMSLPLLVFAIYFTSSGYGQTFNSGSTGADGPLNLTNPGTIYFDPKALNLHPAIENIYNFTTINIGKGVTVIFSAKILTGPMYWLAQGDVTIYGTLILDGETGPNATNTSERIPAAGGAGGYGGGVGAGPNGLSPQAGNGPGGGTAGAPVGGDGSWPGNQYLVPLVGGSGGGGGQPCQQNFGGGGGGGGGAILIASSTTIFLIGTNSTRSDRTILARGGSGGCQGGGGSGGAVRLVATTLEADFGGDYPWIDVTGPGNNNGEMRFEAFNLNLGSLQKVGPALFSTPFKLVLPTTGPGSLSVTSVAGITFVADPFTFPDVVINSSVPVPVTLRGQYIPIGTVPKLFLFSENGPDQIIQCPALQGTFQSSTSTVMVTFPPGGSRGFIKATWRQ